MHLLLTDQAIKDTTGLIFTWFILIPAIVTGLIVVAVVAAKGEKREDEKLHGRWGRRRGSID